jgi:hypothetical protein
MCARGWNRLKKLNLSLLYVRQYLSDICTTNDMRTIHPELCMEPRRRISRRTKIVWANVVCAAVSLGNPWPSREVHQLALNWLLYTRLDYHLRHKFKLDLDCKYLYVPLANIYAGLNG